MPRPLASVSIASRVQLRTRKHRAPGDGRVFCVWFSWGMNDINTILLHFEILFTYEWVIRMVLASCFIFLIPKALQQEQSNLKSFIVSS